MIVIYTQDNTIIRDNADAAREDLISLYGEKLSISLLLKRTTLCLA